MTDDDIKRVVFEHTKLNPNQADDQVLLNGIVRAVRQCFVLDALPCERCGGAGHIEVPEGRGPDVYFTPVNCPACDGTGTGGALDSHGNQFNPAAFRRYATTPR